MSEFPFDEQTCRLKFGSWTYHDAALNITISEGTNPSLAYEERDETNHGNKTFEEWYINVNGYEKNGVRGLTCY